MKTYLQVFINYKQNNKINILLIAKFAYNNVKTTSISHIHFKLNYNYHFHISYKENLNSLSKSKSTIKSLAKLRELIIIYKKSL